MHTGITPPGKTFYIDCLVCASAAMVLAEPGLERRRRITSLDIGATCLSFLHALDLMSLTLAAGRNGNVVIVSSDVSTFTTDPANRKDNGILATARSAASTRASRKSR